MIHQNATLLVTDELLPHFGQNVKADFKELMAIKADAVVASHQLCLDQKAMLKHTAQTTPACKELTV